MNKQDNSNHPTYHRPLSLLRLGTILARGALAWCGIGTVTADTTVWTPAVGSQNWFLPANWRAILPTAADAAVVSAGTTIVQGSTAAVASSVSISAGGVTVGDLEAGTLNVGGQIAVSGGRLALNFGSMSFNSLAIGTGGAYADTRAGTLTLTGVAPGITVGSTNVVVNSQIAGTSGFNLVGPGSVALTNTNTYSGGTVVSALSTLVVGNGGSTGTLGAGEVRNLGTLVFGRTDTSTITNVISGSGSLVQGGTGTTILAADNSYAGNTTISAGTLQVGSGGTSGSLGTGAVANSGSLVFNRSDDIVLAAAVSGTGSVTQSGNGKLTLTGANTFSGTTTISSGSLQVGAGGTSGSLGSGNVTNNATLIFNRSDNVVVPGAIAGNGTLTHAGTGTLTLAGNNTYSGSTIINGGTVQVGSGGASGALGTGNVTNNGAVVFNRTGAVLVPGVISGSGSLTQSGSGVTVLSGNNTYAGLTTISAGTLVIGNAGASGTLGSGNVVNNETLAFDRVDTLVVNNVISGTGSLRQAGTGLVTIAADNSYSGGTVISSGGLQVGNGGTSGSLGTGSITNNATLIFNRSDDLLVVPVISGTGAVAHNGTGKLSLVANNTYSGSTLIGTGGSLQVGLGGTAGSLGTGAVVNNGVLSFNRTDAVTVNNSISGIGSLVQAGSGTITLLGNNTYATGTTISAGTIQVGNGGVIGTLGAGAVTNNGALVINRSDNLLVANVISGTGTVQQAGTGIVALSGNNTYTGTTTISAGTLQVGNGGAVGTVGTGAVVNNGTLAFNRADTVTFSNPLSGTGGLQQSGAGTVILTGPNSLTGTNQINAGTLQVGNGGATGSLAAGAITNNSRLVFNRSDTVVVDGAISGTGNVTQSGTGTLVLAGDNSYTGITTVSSGRLQVGIGGTVGALGTGGVVNNGVLAFQRSDVVGVAGPITGTGSVQQSGTGTVRLTGANTYTGGTVISAGTLQIGEGGVLGTLGTGNVTNNAQLIFNRSDALSIDNLIEGSGRVRHSGAGTLTLSRSNTYSGGTTIDGGGTLRVLSGASLGTGDLTLTRGTIRADAGTLTNRTTLAVGGNYTQAAGTELELGVAGIGTNEFDRVRVTGRANLNGTLRLTALGTYRPVHNTQFVVLSATGGVTGQFSGVTNSVTVSPLLDLQVKYNPNDVTLYWGHLSFVPYAANDSQRAVAAALDSIVTSTAAEDVALIDRLDYDFISNLRPGLQGAFDAIAPNGLTAMFGTSFAILDLQGDQFLKRANELLADYPAIYSAALRDQAASAQAFDAYVKNPWSVYVELPFSSVGVDPTATTKGYDVKTRGVRFGLDRRLGDHFFVGLSGGFNNSKADVTGGTEIDASGYGADVYAVWLKQGLHLLGLVGGTVNSMDTTRQSFGGVATGSADGMGWTGLVGGGYDVQKGAWKVGGQATLQYMRAEIDPFTETGSLAPLRVLSQSAESVHTQVGASVRYRSLVGPWTILTPQLYVGWRHELQSDRLALDSQFAGRVGQTFTVYGPKLGTDSIIGSAGLSVQWRPAVNTAVNYTRQVGRSGYTSENFQLTARLSF